MSISTITEAIGRAVQIRLSVFQQNVSLILMRHETVCSGNRVSGSGHLRFDGLPAGKELQPGEQGPLFLAHPNNWGEALSALAAIILIGHLTCVTLILVKWSSMSDHRGFGLRARGQTR